MNKNAYEIRLEVLKEAHSDYLQKYHQKINLLQEVDTRNYESLLRHGHESKFVPVLTPEKIDDLFPTNEQIIKHAEELYSFVS